MSKSNRFLFFDKRTKRIRVLGTSVVLGGCILAGPQSANLAHADYDPEPVQSEQASQIEATDELDNLLASLYRFSTRLFGSTPPTPNRDEPQYGQFQGRYLTPLARPHQIQLGNGFLQHNAHERAYALWVPNDADLALAFQTFHYDLTRIKLRHDAVPRLMLRTLPSSWAGDLHSDQRKDLFIKIILPLILRANEVVYRERQRLRRLIEKGPARQADFVWVRTIAKSYGRPSASPSELLNAIDQVPPSLAVAQAALETGWGSSRFATVGNALYGQWTWEKDAGLVPEKRADGARHKIKTFPSLYQSVAAYVNNLNRLPAYSEFRRLRAGHRAQGLPLDGLSLAPTLENYSEERSAYVEKIKRIIRSNRLTSLDAAVIRP